VLEAWDSGSPVICFLAAAGDARSSIFSSLSRRPPEHTLFPYTTLFRSDEDLKYDPEWVARDREDYERFPYSSRSIVVDHDGAGRSEEHTLNSSHVSTSYAVFCSKKQKNSFPTRHPHIQTAQLSSTHSPL